MAGGPPVSEEYVPAYVCACGRIELRSAGSGEPHVCYSASCKWQHIGFVTVDEVQSPEGERE